ncbi:tetratricopeptide repeat protein [Nocardioides sp. InS609-2]|uniref:tetratricopeptide repeat protein n=1 Tax=Nocardioides sp. InS609-2 TaxID=2760705 RepID=UPI00180A5894|nr:tetratricopeptide repeat protein [Nocardioides sp. InS609-2]MBA3783324.1 tetratricopeptide repeat protein [Nocardioides sp.]
MNGIHPSGRCSRFARALSVTAVLALGATACAGADEPSTSATPAPDAKKAATALDAGLKAHASGDLTTAASNYDKTLKYDPKNKFAFYNLALIDEASGNYGLAEQKYRAALKTDPAYEPALFNLAILRTSRDPQESIDLYQQAVAVNPKDAAAWLNLGLLLRAAGQQRSGDEAVLRAIGLNPDLKDPKAAG